MVVITNAKQLRTLERIFEDTAPKDMLWRDVVSLFEHLGYRMYGMGGSMMCFRKEGVPPFRVHKPHPSKHVAPKNVTRVKNYLEQVGVTP